MYYSLFDKKLEKFNGIFQMPDNKTALVVIDREIKEKKTPVGHYPEDFVLWQIGDFNEDTGAFVADLQKVQDLAEVYHE